MRTDAFAEAFQGPERGGALLVDKPAGPSSHDVVGWARRALGTKRVGHTGTLDPFASGLLILLVGPATRLAEYLSGLPKTYVARARLGIRTDTHDSEGRIVGAEGDWKGIERDDVLTTLARFRGHIEQVPPQFSAKKIAGEAMYKKARRGETVELEPVGVEIMDIHLIEFEPPDLSFEVACTSGTYVRALARDVGEELGAGAHLTTLRRTSVGSFPVEEALAGDSLREGTVPTPGQWIESGDALRHLRAVRVPSDGALRLRQGGRIPLPEDGLPGGEPIVVLDDVGLLGIAEVRDGQLSPKKILQGPLAS